MKTKLKTFLKTNQDLVEVVIVFVGCAALGVGVGMLTYEGAKAGFYKAFETWTIKPVAEFKPYKVD